MNAPEMLDVDHKKVYDFQQYIRARKLNKYSRGYPESGVFKRAAERLEKQYPDFVEAYKRREKERNAR